jgi:hypothetical protein
MKGLGIPHRSTQSDEKICWCSRNDSGIFGSGAKLLILSILARYCRIPIPFPGHTGPNDGSQETDQKAAHGGLWRGQDSGGDETGLKDGTDTLSDFQILEARVCHLLTGGQPRGPLQTEEEQTERYRCFHDLIGSVNILSVPTGSVPTGSCPHRVPPGPVPHRVFLSQQSPGLHKMSGLWAPRYTLGLDARRRFILETFSSSVSDAYLYRSICRRKV